MKRKTKQILGGVSIVFGTGFLVFGTWLKNYMIGIPETVGPKSYDFKRQEIHVSYQGIDLYGQALIPISETSKAFPTVIYAHGAESDYNADMTTLESLAKSGIACYTFDFYGWTDRSTGPKGVHWFKKVPRKDNFAYEEKVRLQVEDLDAVVEKVKTLDFVDTDNLFLLGSSMGGATVAASSIKHTDDIAGIILQYPAINLVPTAQITGGEYDVNQYQGKVLLLQGTKDVIVPQEMSDSLIAHYNSVEPNHARYLIYEGQPHVFRGAYKVQAARDIYQFIQENLRS